DVSERKIRFTTNLSAKDLMKKIEDSVADMEFRVQKKNGKIKVIQENKEHKTPGSLSVTIEDYEDILLPTDEQWPFLLRFPIGCFGICLGLSSQAVLWHNLATSPATSGFLEAKGVYLRLLRHFHKQFVSVHIKQDYKHVDSNEIKNEI
ncbi:hypothetical protein KIW84_061692, partial [Lathyrus oleraceus]